MKICFIDDSWGTTLRMMYAISNYYRCKCQEKSKNDDLTIYMLKVSFGSEDDEEKVYFMDEYKKEDINVDICTSEEEIKKCINKIKKSNEQDKIVFMIDILLKENESNLLQEDIENLSNEEDIDKRILSMKCKDFLDANDTYYFYSQYAETTTVADWGRRYREIYNQDEPAIFEREELMPQNFKEEYAKKITGV